MDEIFVSYRRDDAGLLAPVAADALADRFGAGSVFLDVGSLRPGVPFPPELRAAVRRCLLMVVLVGPRWLAARAPAGGRRIDDPADWVRQELSAALAAGVPMVPVLFDGASLPRRAELPRDVRGLLDFGAFRVHPDRHRPDLAELGERVAELEPRLRPADRGPAGGSDRPGGPVQVNHVARGDAYVNQGDGGMTVNVDRTGRGR